MCQNDKYHNRKLNLRTGYHDFFNLATQQASYSRKKLRDLKLVSNNILRNSDFEYLAALDGEYQSKLVATEIS